MPVPQYTASDLTQGNDQANQLRSEFGNSLQALSDWSQDWSNRQGFLTQQRNAQYGVNYTDKDWQAIEEYWSDPDKGNPVDATSSFTPGFSYVSPQYLTGRDNNTRMRNPRYTALAEKYPEVMPKIMSEYNNGMLNAQNQVVGQTLNLGTYFLPYVGQARMLYDAGKFASEGDWKNAAVSAGFGAAGALGKVGRFLSSPSINIGERAYSNLANASRAGNSLGVTARTFNTPFGTFQTALGARAFTPNAFGRSIGKGLSYSPQAISGGTAGIGAYGLIKDNLFDNDLSDEELKQRNWQNGLYFGLGALGSSGYLAIPLSGKSSTSTSLTFKKGGKLWKY